MAIVPDDRAGADCGCRCASRTPLIVDPTVPPSVETVLLGPGGKTSAPMLILPGGVRVCTDALGADSDALEWWKDLAVAALYASLCYQGEESLSHQYVSGSAR